MKAYTIKIAPDAVAVFTGGETPVIANRDITIDVSHFRSLGTNNPVSRSRAVDSQAQKP